MWCAVARRRSVWCAVARRRSVWCAVARRRWVPAVLCCCCCCCCCWVEHRRGHCFSARFGCGYHLQADAGAPAEWGMGEGRRVDLAGCAALLSIKDLKARIGAEVCRGAPVNKLQVKSATLGFLKDHLSLAHYNVAPGEVLEISRKKR